MKIKKISKLLFLLIFTGVFSVLFCAFQADAKPKVKQAFDRGLIVYAPPSLTNAMQEILRDFSVKENISVSSSFDSSKVLEERVEEGEPVNIFITDDNLIMKDLQQKGLINVYSISQIAADSLSIVAPNGNYMIKKLDKFQDYKDKLTYISNKSLLVIPDVEVEKSGRLTQTSFENEKLWDRMKRSVIKAATTTESLYLASKGENLAVVYNSDAVSDESVKTVVELPELFNDKIIYQAVIVADITNTSSNDDAQKFINFLKSPQVKAVFKKHGLKDI